MPLLVAALAVLALLLALPRSGAAQTRPTPCDPPTDAICQATIGIGVFISPEGSTTTGSTTSQSIDITVQFCGPQPFMAGSDVVTLDSVPQSFVFSSKPATALGPYYCHYYAESTGTVSIPGEEGRTRSRRRSGTRATRWATGSSATPTPTSLRPPTA